MSTLRGKRFPLPTTFVGHQASHPAGARRTSFPNRYFQRVCARRPIPLDARLPPLTICLDLQVLLLDCAAHIAFPGRHCPPACAMWPTLGETRFQPVTNYTPLCTSILNFSAYIGWLDGTRPEPYVELKGPHSARDTLPSGFLAAACDRRQGRENWLHPGVPAKEAFAASPGIPVPGLPPPSASRWRLRPRQYR